MLKILGNRIIINIFGIKIFTRFKSKKSKYKPNTFIALGTNCYVRTKLTQYGIKALKKYGELSYPFDLCVTPIESIAGIIEKDFSDYLEDIQQTKNKDFNWENTKYNIQYQHDKNLSIKDFLKRYKKRIKNFKQLYKQENICYITTVKNPYDVKDINRIYNALRHKHGINTKFKYFVCNFISQNEKKFINKQKLNEEILYTEIICSESYWKDWFYKKHDCEPENLKITEQFIKFIEENNYDSFKAIKSPAGKSKTCD